MTSAIYTGWVRHRRFSPRTHHFSYRVFMMYLRLDELPGLFDGIPFWSARRRALAWFRRADFLGDPARPLEEAVRDTVLEQTGVRPEGPVYLLANLRYFGFNINPIACYYCFNRAGTRVEYVVAEVTNTPWNERHCYVLPTEPGRAWLHTRFDKDLHVSPFNPMDMEYRWHSNTPGEKICLHLANHRDGEKIFDASLSLQREPLDGTALNRKLLAYPFMTLKVMAAIYYQALRLWLKRLPFYSHPTTQARLTHD